MISEKPDRNLRPGKSRPGNRMNILKALDNTIRQYIDRA
jgi:hypothetical protein